MTSYVRTELGELMPSNLEQYQESISLTNIKEE